VAHGQQAGKLPTIGFLGADASAFSPWTAAFVAHLRELGWIENRNVAIEYRWSEGRTERYAEIAAEFVRLKVDVIVTVGSAVPSVRQATSVIPIVFAVAIDPVGSSRPGTRRIPQSLPRTSKPAAGGSPSTWRRAPACSKWRRDPAISRSSLPSSDPIGSRV
jgi:ABC transporter substrate binding protein